MSRTPAMIFLPPCDSFPIPGSLDPVASPAEDLEIFPCPLITSPGDWPDVIQDAGMMVIRSFNGSGFMDLPLTPGNTSLPVHPGQVASRDSRSHFEPVLDTAGGLASRDIRFFSSGVFCASITFLSNPEVITLWNALTHCAEKSVAII